MNKKHNLLVITFIVILFGVGFLFGTNSFYSYIKIDILNTKDFNDTKNFNNDNILKNNNEIVININYIEEKNRIKKQEEDIIKKNILDKKNNFLIDDFLNSTFTYIENEDKKHLKTPDNVKMLYFSSHSINNREKFNNFLKIAKEKEINSIMIDIKEVDGYVSVKLNDDDFGKIKPVSNNKIKNIGEIIKELHDNNIYTIARIVVFKDNRLANNRPDLALKWKSNGKIWTDYKGNKYTDQYSKEVWDYHKELAIAVYELGFDEINFDYVRFPSDGYISEIYHPFSNEIIKNNIKWGKIIIIDKFTNYITTKIKKYNPLIPLSVDVFGLTTDTNLFQIGQNLESFLLSFDFVSPMIYPSHYGKGYYGYTYPDNNPYPIINNSLNNAIKKIDKLNIEIKNANNESRYIKYNNYFEYDKKKITDNIIDVTKLRPFLQGFSCTWCSNYTNYNRSKFREEVNGVIDAGINSWGVRSAGSYYHINRYDNID